MINKKYFFNHTSNNLNLIFLSILIIWMTQCIFAQKSNFKSIIFGCYTNDINDFESFVAKAKEAGATHIQINAEDLPLAYWEMKPEGDPYPAWVITNPGLLKIFIPDSLKRYFKEAEATARQVSNILEERCKILRRYNLKAVFHTFEPQMLPETVYEDHPLWRGPQADHPVRSKTARFAPAIENPEVLELYTEAVRKFITRCPEVNIIYFRTNDSGTGLDWSPYLYNGTNGNSNYKNMSMDQRIQGFFKAMQKGAEQAGSNLAVAVYNTNESEAQNFVRNLDSNMAIDGYEGPDARQFKADVDDLLYYSRSFSPIVGIPRPYYFLEQLEKANKSDSPRLFVAIADRYNLGLYLKIYHEFMKKPTTGLIENLELLMKIAEVKVGKENARQLFDLWVTLNEVQKLVTLTNGGGTIFNLGCVQERWLVRPLVPFPSELKPEEKLYYRKHIFQAQSEEAANYLLDLQGMRIYTGQGGRRYIQKVIDEGAKPYIEKAISISKYLSKHVNANQKKKYELLTKRLIAYSYLINNVFDIVDYQSQLDQLDLNGNQRGQVAANGDVSSAARSKILETARREIDNTSNLIVLLESLDDIGNVIDHAESKDKEYVRLLGPDLVEQLKKKNKIMNAHWKDYNKIFIKPNFSFGKASH